MKWSFKIFTLFGIPVKLHLTFLLLLLFIALTPQKPGGIGGLPGTITVLLVFACVLLHEFSHSMLAKKYGHRVRDITLLPIGGVSNIEEMPEEPREEIWLALAGPMMSLALAGIFYAAVTLVRPAADPEFIGGSLLGTLFYINFMLGLFNMIPALPMDGGRVLRGALAMKLGRVKATRVAVSIGQAFAIVFLFVGIFYDWWLALIAIFIYIGAEGEDQALKVHEALKGAQVSRAMIVDPKTVRPDTPMSDVVSMMCHGLQDDFPVVSDGRAIGILSKQDIFRAVKDGAGGRPAAEFMHADFPVVSSDLSLEDIFRSMRQSGLSAIPVLADGRVSGLITLEQIGRYNMVCGMGKK